MLTDHKHNLHLIMAMYCGGVEVISRRSAVIIRSWYLVGITVGTRWWLWNVRSCVFGTWKLGFVYYPIIKKGGMYSNISDFISSVFMVVRWLSKRGRFSGLGRSAFALHFKSARWPESRSKKTVQQGRLKVTRKIQHLLSAVCFAARMFIYATVVLIRISRHL